MTTAALVVAGGQGSRMARSGGAYPKPLMTVAGRSLLEWNVDALTAAGIGHIHIAIGADQTETSEHIERCCRPLVESVGGSISVVAEQTPLGSIGAAALLDPTVDRLLVVNADNLTTLDLAAMLDDHAQHTAAVTLAIHEEPFAMPFGEVTVNADRVVAYVEKPTYSITVSSALTVLSRRAVDLIVPGTSVMLPDLVQRALAADLVVHAHRHTAAWIDVNDLDAVGRAEDLVAAHPTEFRRASA
jgi:NDP-sugar pyrophosphorylase family protein